MCHIVTARLLGAELCSISILPVGVNAVINQTRLNRFQNALIYISGPLGNLLIGMALYLFEGKYTYAELAIKINISLAIFNMLPILPMDGGRCVFEVIGGRIGMFRASRYMVKISVIMSLLIIITGALAVINKIYNVSLVLIGIYILSGLRENKKEIASMNIRNFIYRRSRILRKGVYSARNIVVMKNSKLSDGIKSMDYADMFHIVYILDDEMKIIHIMTEQEVIDALIDNNYDVTFEQLLNGAGEKETTIKN